MCLPEILSEGDILANHAELQNNFFPYELSGAFLPPSLLITGLGLQGWKRLGHVAVWGQRRGGDSLEHEVQVGGETRVGELCCAVIVVHKVDPSRCRVADLPAWRQRPKLLTVHITQVPEGEKRTDR